jgi:E3 ubiquitin-protein ligase CBL
MTSQANSSGSTLVATTSSNSSSSHSVHITNKIKLEKKHFEKITKLAEKLLKYCSSDKMNLINSPPYIIDILPDICQVFNTIYVVYEHKLHVLNDIDYFCVLIKNCLDKFQELVDLFKQAGKRMYEENSIERQKLVKFTLTFSHILAEMKSIFPKDVYEGAHFRIAKKDAEEFWKSNFNDRVIISWIEFEMKLNQVHKISDKTELFALRETIQLTKTKYISIFEFDIFTRLFQPWNNLLNNWKFLVTEHPGYSAFSTYDEVHKRLQRHINKPGSYLFRLSCTKLGQWAIGYVTTDNKILQTIPQSLVQALIDGQKQGLYIYPDGRDIRIDISSQIAVMSASRIQISREQHDMYFDIGSSFQLCKICSENNKDRKLEPCGHLICSSCLESWQELQQTPSCPFCRCEIKTFEPIIISPFESSKRQNSLNGTGICSSNSHLNQKSTISTITHCNGVESDDNSSNSDYIEPDDPFKAAKSSHKTEKSTTRINRQNSDDGKS